VTTTTSPIHAATPADVAHAAHTYPGIDLEHRDPHCPGIFAADPAPSRDVRAERVVCGRCGTQYPADVHTLLSLAREHLAAMSGHLAGAAGRTALRRERAQSATQHDGRS
jgi:hypothetical protein